MTITLEALILQIAKCWLLDWGILLGPLTPLLLVQMICCWCRRTVIEQIVWTGWDITTIMVRILLSLITQLHSSHFLTYWHTYRKIVCTAWENLGKVITHESWWRSIILTDWLTVALNLILHACSLCILVSVWSFGINTWTNWCMKFLWMYRCITSVRNDICVQVSVTFVWMCITFVCMYRCTDISTKMLYIHIGGALLTYICVNVSVHNTPNDLFPA